MENLSAPFPTKDRSIHIVSTRPDGMPPEFDRSGVILHKLDLADAAATADLIDLIRPDELFHLAWATGDTPNRYSDPTNRLWAPITENLISSFAASGGRRAILAGSCIEYGPVSGVLPESAVARPDTAYGIGKYEAGRRALEIAGISDQLSVVVARIFFVMGRYETPNRLVPHIIRRLLAGRSAELSTGTQLRDYAHAWDVATALIAAADSELEGVVNVGSGLSISVRDLAVLIAEMLERPNLLRFGAKPIGADTAPEITADISRITAHTGWTPAIDIRSAAADVVKWWSSYAI